LIPPDTARAWVDIDLDALGANARAFQRLAGARLMPVVKADAYGLGVGAVVRALEAVDPWGYGVGTVEEGRELRELGIERPILILTPLLPELAAAHAASGLRPTIGDIVALDAWLSLGELPFHLEIDTGMSRAGIRWDDAEALAAMNARAGRAPGWEGAFTHFHSAEADPEATRTQWSRFEEVLGRFHRRPPIVHAANSAAGVAGACGHTDLVRPGLYLYGGRVGDQTPRPVVALRARVVACRRLRPGDTVSYGATWRARRDTTIATVAIGYFDGVPLNLSSRGLIEVRGATHRIAGRVTMDMTMVDLGETEAVPGEVATIFGGLVSLEEQAAAAGTVPYDLLTAIGPRVVRRYGGPDA
jgi:alanine racemase